MGMKRSDICMVELLSPYNLNSHISHNHPSDTAALCNIKLLELATRSCSKILYIWLSCSVNGTKGTGFGDEGNQSEENENLGIGIRSQLSAIYNQLWDFCLGQQKLGLDCRVLVDPEFENGKGNNIFKSKAEMVKSEGIEMVLNAGRNIDTACFVQADFAISSILSSNSSDDGAVVVENNELSSDVTVISLEKHLFEEVFAEKYRLFNSFLSLSLPKFNRIVLGGTFDHLHNGHKTLLTTALTISNPNCVILVGITSDSILKSSSKRKPAKNNNASSANLNKTNTDQTAAQKTNGKCIQSYDIRKQNVENFVCSLIQENSIRLEFCEIFDSLGPTCTEENKNLQCIVVSSETLKGARLINDKRRECNMKPLEVMVVMRSNVNTLSSSFVRERQSERKGSGLAKQMNKLKDFFSKSFAKDLKSIKL